MAVEQRIARGSSRVTYGLPVQTVMSLIFDLVPDGIVLSVGSGEDSSDPPRKTVFHLDLQVPSTAEPDRFIRGDTAQLPMQNQSIDGVVAKDVLEHVQDPIAALAELRRVAKQSALCVVTVPQAKPRAVWADPTHIRGFTPRALEMAAQAAGWSITSIQPVDALPGIDRLGLTRWILAIWRLPLMRFAARNWLVVLAPSSGPMPPGGA